jgi:hypothetical protein
MCTLIFSLIVFAFPSSSSSSTNCQEDWSHFLQLNYTLFDYIIIIIIILFFFFIFKMSLLFQSTLRSTVSVGGAAATKRAGYLGVLSSSTSFVGDRRRSFGSDADSGPLVKTALNDLHKELGGDMVPFAGYELPVLYKGTDNGGVMKEHLWCRSEGKASLFDVSHMGQVCS